MSYSVCSRHHVKNCGNYPGHLAIQWCDSSFQWIVLPPPLHHLKLQPVVALKAYCAVQKPQLRGSAFDPFRIATSFTCRRYQWEVYAGMWGMETAIGESRPSHLLLCHPGFHFSDVKQVKTWKPATQLNLETGIDAPETRTLSASNRLPMNVRAHTI